MKSSAVLQPSVREAFQSFIDYAGLFPPAELAVDQAIEEYDCERKGDSAWMLGRFIVPASRIEELGERQSEFPLTVIVGAPAGGDATGWFGAIQQTLEAIAARRRAGARVEALEAALPVPRWQREGFDAPIGQFAALLDRSGLRELPAYAELTRSDRWSALLPGAMEAAARAGIGVKLRCGGLTAQAFPSVAEVAAFIAAASKAGVPFKATAGLHHPVRHRDRTTGFVMHGFLNLLAAAALAPQADEATLERIVGEEDAGAFSFDPGAMSWRELHAGTERLAQTRARLFAGYGSCSFSEPVDDLVALHILAQAK